jgi:hypothetical protein
MEEMRPPPPPPPLTHSIPAAVQYRAGILEKNRFLELSRNQVYGIESTMSHKCTFLKLELNSFLGSPSPPPENQVHDEIDSNKESILWN